MGTFENETQFVLPSWPQVTFDEQAARLMGPRQITALQSLESFEFVNSEVAPFPEEFLRGLSGFIRRRAEQLATFEPVSREELLARC